MPGMWDRLLDVAAETLKQSADAIMPSENEQVTTVEAMARAGVAGLARGIASDIKTAHCQARTRYSMGHMLRCGKDATMTVDGLKFCTDCAPDNAKPIVVEANGGQYGGTQGQ